MNELKRKTDKQWNQIDKIAKGGKDRVFEYYKLIDDFINKGEYGYFEKTLQRYYKIDISNFRDVDYVKKKTWPEILFQTKSSFQTKLKKMYDDRGVYQTSFDIYTSNVNHVQLSLSTPMSQTYSQISTTQSISMSLIGNSIYFNTIDSNIFNVDILKCDCVNNLPINGRLIDTISVTQSTSLTEIKTDISGEYLISVSSRPPLSITNYRFSVSNNNLLGQIYEIEDLTPELRYLIENMEFSKLMGNRTSYLKVVKNGLETIITNTDISLSEEQNLLIRYKLAIDILLS